MHNSERNERASKRTEQPPIVIGSWETLPKFAATVDAYVNGRQALFDMLLQGRLKTNLNVLVFGPEHKDFADQLAIDMATSYESACKKHPEIRTNSAFIASYAMKSANVTSGYGVAISISERASDMEVYLTANELASEQREHLKNYNCPYTIPVYDEVG